MGTACSVRLFSLPGSIRGQPGWGCEQPSLWEALLLIAGDLELDDLYSPFQLKAFYDPLINKQNSSMLSFKYDFQIISLYFSSSYLTTNICMPP